MFKIPKIIVHLIRFLPNNKLRSSLNTERRKIDAH